MASSDPLAGWLYVKELCQHRPADEVHRYLPLWERITVLESELAASRAECEALREQIRMLEAQDDDDEVRRRLRQYEGTEIELAECRAECGALRVAAANWALVERMEEDHVLGRYEHGWCYGPECPEMRTCPHEPDGDGFGSRPEAALRAALGEEDGDA